MNKFTYSVGGDFKVDKFSFEGNLTYNKRFYPNDKGTKYGSGGFIYNLVVWSGTEYDIRDYRDYWQRGKEGETQNWMENTWYDNPYFLANEVRHNDDYDVTNGSLSMKYDVLSWLSFTLRSGFDYYQDKEEWKYAKSYTMNKKGYYYVDQELSLIHIWYMATQYNPYTYEWEEKELVSKGKENFKNFLETGLVTNNNINLSYQSEKGSFRTSLTHVYNKGQYPNTKLNKFT